MERSLTKGRWGGGGGLERFGEVRIVDETNGFGLDFVEKTESGFWSTTPNMGAILLRRKDLGIVCNY